MVFFDQMIHHFEVYYTLLPHIVNTCKSVDLTWKDLQGKTSGRRRKNFVSELPNQVDICCFHKTCTFLKIRILIPPNLEAIGFLQGKQIFDLLRFGTQTLILLINYVYFISHLFCLDFCCYHLFYSVFRS